MPSVNTSWSVEVHLLDSGSFIGPATNHRYREDGYKGADDDDGRSQCGILPIFLGQDEVHHGRRQGAVKKQDLAIDAVGANDLDGSTGCTKTSDNAQQRAP